MSGRGATILRGVLGALAALWVVAHVAAIFTENVNWDEFALLQRVERMTATGRIQGGGRPGAIELVFAPLVADCRDAIETVRKARIVTAAVTFLAIAGLYELVRRMRRRFGQPAPGAWLAVACWVLALPFLRWSLQVRTDPFGVMFGLWGAVVLLAAQRRTWLAVLAGACFGAGFLFTQKVLYIGLLAAIARVATGRWQSPAARWAAVRQALACFAGFVLLVGAYRGLLSLFMDVPPLQSVDAGLRVFDDYRRTFGLRLYRGMLGALGPHLVLVALLAVASLRADRWRRQVWTAWALLGAGVVVGGVHSGTFPYFWITLGLFPAVAFGCCCEALLEVVPARVRASTVVAWGLALAIPAGLYSARLLEDSQRVQRDALAFTSRELDPPRHGFQLEGALICRGEPDPFRVYFRPHIEAAFAAPGADAKVAAFLDTFRSKPVHFVIDSHMIGFFPEPITRFWRENYHAYRGPVCLVGRAVRAGETVRWHVFAPGVYAWQADGTGEGSALLVDGIPVQSGQKVAFERGARVLRAGAVGGRLLYAVKTPAWHIAEPFYAHGAIREIIGGPYFARP